MIAPQSGVFQDEVRFAITLILLASSSALAAGAHAQTPPQSIDDLLKQAQPPAAANVADPTVPGGLSQIGPRLRQSRVGRLSRAGTGRARPLDGRWLAKTPDGVVVYAFAFTDPGSGADRA